MRKKSCDHCGCVAEDLHKHHIIPKSRGGNDSSKNLVSLCLLCHGKAHDVSFRSNKGVVKDGIKKTKNKEKLAADFFLEKENTINKFLSFIEDESHDMYNFIISGLLIGVIDKSFIYGLIHPECLSKRGLYINFTLAHQKTLYSIYEESLK